MIIALISLFLCAMLGGLAAFIPVYKDRSIRLPLIFAGSFLFTVTMVHIIPEVFVLGKDPLMIGVFILCGFYFQQVLEHFTSGVEHGHFHTDHSLSQTTKYSLLSALIVHSILEGTLLIQDSAFHGSHNYSLLLGIVLHKAPAAFALMSVLKGDSKSSFNTIMILVIFSLASPLGYLLNEYGLSLNSQNQSYLFAFVGGSFLHISTTIFVESSPGHSFKLSRIIASLAGALLALSIEFVL